MIASVVSRVRQHIPSVYVVDDGSEDQTRHLAAQAGARLLRHSIPRGKGVALSDGMRQAAEDGFEWVVTLDGDGQHDPDDIPSLLRAVEAGADLVVGNRMHATERMPALRRFVNRWMSQRLTELAGCELQDTQCGYRLVRLADWMALNFDCRHFEFESEFLVRFVRAGKRVTFIPIRTLYGDEESKIRPVRDTIRWFRWYRRITSELSTYAKSTPVAAEADKPLST
jgi:glycosyltransferase involved in cell wall biosynthesis